jgi:protein-disulfide isomerase
MKTRSSFFLICAIVIAGSSLLLQAAWTQEKAAQRPDTVASGGGLTITAEDLNNAAAAEFEKLELQKLLFDASFERNKHQIREATLARMVEEKLLNSEAKKQGATTQALLAKEVTNKLKEPSEEEISAFYEKNKAGIGKPKEQVSTQIREYLKQQNYAKIKADYIEQLKKANGVSVSLEPFRLNLQTEGHPSKGPAAAPITLVEFSDFQCPFCKNYSETLNRVLKDYPNEVRLVFSQCPLVTIHPEALKAAEASLCANEQGRFWEMHDLLYQEQEKIKPEDLKAKAAKLGLNAGTFNTCLDSGRHAQRAKQELYACAKAGVNGTPALFINGRLLPGVRSYEEVVAVIKEEIQKKSPPTPAKP